MEKSAPPDTTPPHTARKPRTLARVLLAAACAAAIFKTGGWSVDRSPQATDGERVRETFTWGSLTASPKLAYVPCYEGPRFDGPFACARLALPMDYWNGTTNATIGLAVIRKPAAVPVTDKRYGGAILLNPGGPGGSGVGFLFRGGNGIRKAVDVKDEKYYDLISFDPRGVGSSEPAIECFKNLMLEHSWQVRTMEEGVMEASDAAFGRLWSMAIARSGSCSLPLPDGEPDMRKYVTTASVARDMLEIVERHGEWREEEVKRLLAGKHCSRGQLNRHATSAAAVPESLVYKPGEEMIQYWGFSYGTYLGNTFAAMFPQRVGRLIVDGVVDAYNYKATLWSDNLIDTEKDWAGFSYHCARAGYPACALANRTGASTAKGVEGRVANITTNLYHNPLPVIGSFPEVITYSDVKNFVAAGLYTPIASFPYIANLLADIENGNGTRFAALLEPYHEIRQSGQFTMGEDFVPLRNRTKGVGISQDATMAIACSDGDDQSWVTRSEFRKYVKELAKMSPTIGSLWSALRMGCIHYSIRPYHRFEGPWIANTSHPLLLIGNTADPVTPVIHAINMAKGFDGAVALTQDSSGHCSLSTYSNCTIQYVRRYFHTGELPPVNTTCPVDELPFGPGPSDAGSLSVELLEAKTRHAEIAAALHDASGGLLGSFQ
ncbi:hypothetical protein LTR53_011348 [Teratosphaeriaceae sp. CCFEE 6253]|nr:hypothetical protein LTR53_011348 [Teratosphaeriaceae sp. CCFEE 6253]